jgi:hypothetical protein
MINGVVIKPMSAIATSSGNAPYGRTDALPSDCIASAIEGPAPANAALHNEWPRRFSGAIDFIKASSQARQKVGKGALSDVQPSHGLAKFWSVSFG